MAMINKAISTIKASGLNPGDAINVICGVSDFREAKKEGDSNLKAVAKAGASFAWGEIFYGGLSDAVGKTLTAVGAGPKLTAVGSIGLTMGVMLLPAAIGMVGAVSEHGSKGATQVWANRGQLGSGYFNMSEAGYTMRQRSLNAIRQNGLNTRSVLGNEARTYYRG